MRVTKEDLSQIIKEEIAAVLSEEDLHKWFSDNDGDGQSGWEQIGGKYDGKPCAKQPGQKTKPKCASPEKAATMSKKEKESAARRKRKKDPNPNRKGKAKNVNTDPKKESLEVDEAKKKPCKPSKGKRFAKRVDGKCRSFGQKGQAKGGGDRIRPGTKKGDAYCARSLKIKKCKNPPCANALSRKKWKCKGAKSMK